MADLAEGIGTEAQQRARLSHMINAHGFELLACPACDDSPSGCETCDGMGCVFRRGKSSPCGAACPMLDVRPV